MNCENCEACSCSDVEWCTLAGQPTEKMWGCPLENEDEAE